MLARTLSSTTSGYPEIVDVNTGDPVVQFVYELNVHAAEVDKLPRDVEWRISPLPGWWGIFLPIPAPYGYSWGVNPRQITELGFEWFIVKPGWFGPVPGTEINLDGSTGPEVWDPATSSWDSINWQDFQPREATAAAPSWEAAAQPVSVSTTAGDGTARFTVPASMLPADRWVEIAVRSRYAVDKPRRHNDKIGFTQMQIVGSIHENVAPTLSLGSPFGSSHASPVTISGYAVDRDLHGSGVSGVSSVEYEINDLSAMPRQSFDFETLRWTSPEDAASKKVETLTPIVGPGGVVFKEQWSDPYPQSSSNDFEVVVRVLDGSGNVGTVRHNFLLDDVDPVIRFEFPRRRQVVTGDVITVDGIIEDHSDIASIQMTVASNNTGRYLDASRQWVDRQTSFEPEVDESNGLTTFRWSWGTPAETEYFSIYVDAVDSAGNSSRTHHSFGWMPADTDAPEVQLMSPRANTTQAGIMRVRGRAFDNVELDDVRVEVWSVDSNDQPLIRRYDEPVSAGGATTWQYFDTTVDVGTIATINGSGRYLLAAVAIDVTGYEARDLHLISLEP